MTRSRKQSCSQSADRGSLLVFAVWTLTTFAVLGIGVSRATSAQLALAKRLEGQAVSQYLAQAAVLHAWAMRKAATLPYDTLKQFRTEQHQELGRGAFIYTLEDENSRVPLNTISQEILARVPALGLDGAIAITTSTWRPFPLKEEIVFLDDKITPEMYQQAKPFLTVYGNGKVNINTASPETLKALGMDEGLVDVVTRFRTGHDGKEGTEDDGVFESPGEIINTLRSSTSLFAAQEATLIQLVTQGLLDVRSAAFTIHIQTSLLGKPLMTYAIVLDTTQEKVKRWSEL